MRKGFTLIELLAVIVILAIIALIATPIILNIVEDSKKSAATESARLYVDGLQNKIVSENMTREYNPSSCTITNGNISCDGQSLDYTVDGQAPTSGTISFNNGVISGYQLYISGYTVTKNGSVITTTKGEPTIEFNGTYVAGGQNDTYIGIAYLDPTNLSTTCTAQLAAQNLNDKSTPTPTGVTSGCMKFYVYNDDGINYTMILDHNTSGNLPWVNQDDYIEAGGTLADWNNGIQNNKGPATANKRLVGDTAGWEGSPRLITADEIAHIVGADTALGWDSTKSDSEWICLDGSGSTYTSWQTRVGNLTNLSSHAWLFNNTSGCRTNGCEIEDNNRYPYPTKSSSTENSVSGYWTSTPDTADSLLAWGIGWIGYLDNDVEIDYAGGWGVRPVITLPKSIFE